MAWSLILYNAVNVYTDTRSRKTKNLWHLGYLLAAVVLFFSGMPLFSWVKVGTFMLTVVVWLIVGLFFELIRLFTPGDTKMLVVNGAWITLLAYELTGQGYVLGAMLQFFGSVTITFLIGGVILTIFRFGWQAFFVSLYFRQTLKMENSKYVSMPGAVPISLAVIITIFTMG